MELNVAGLDLSVLHVDLVTDQDDRDILADSHDVSVPVGHVLVSDSAGDIKHNDGTLSLDVVSISETSELLLTGSIPHVEANLSTVSVELQWVDLDSQGGDVLLLELTSSVTLNKSGLTDTTVTDEQELEFWDSRHMSEIETLG